MWKTKCPTLTLMYWLCGCLLLLLISAPVLATDAMTEIDMSSSSLTMKSTGLQKNTSISITSIPSNLSGYLIKLSNPNKTGSSITVESGSHIVQFVNLSLSSGSTPTIKIAAGAELTIILPAGTASSLAATTSNCIQMGDEAKLNIKGEGNLTLANTATSSPLISSASTGDSIHLTISGGILTLNGAASSQTQAYGESTFTMTGGSVFTQSGKTLSGFPALYLSGGNLRVGIDPLDIPSIHRDGSSSAALRRVTLGQSAFANKKIDDLNLFLLHNQTALSVYSYGFQSMTADASGSFSLWLPDGSYRIHTCIDGSYYETDPFTVSSSGVTGATTLNPCGEIPLQITSASGSFTVGDNPAVSSHYTTAAVGATLTLNAQGENFWYWVDSGRNKILATTAKYSYRVQRPGRQACLQLQAVYHPAASEPIQAVFAAPNGDILATVQKEDGVLQAPTDLPNYYGMEFSGWSAEPSAITKHAILEAIYRPKASTAITLTVAGAAQGALAHYYQGQRAELTAASAAQGQSFSGWQLNGQTVSFSPTYGFYVLHDGDHLEAQYGDASAATPQPLIALTSGVLENSTAYFISAFSVPEGATILEVGMLVLVGAADSAAILPDQLTLAKLTDPLPPYHTSITPQQSSGQYVVSVKLTAQETAYARAYLSWRQTGGEQETLYSEVIAVSAQE